MKNKYLIAFSILLQALPGHSSGQVVLTEEDALNRALKNSPSLKAAALLVDQHKQLQSASFNLSNPDITLESPSGEFMTVGFLQSFEFPTVYVKQGQLAKANTTLAEKGKILTETEITRIIKSSYLNLQYNNSLVAELQKKDSLYLGILQSAERQFTAGKIDFVTKTYAAVQYGAVHQHFLQTQKDALSSMQQLQLYTGITEKIKVPTIKKNKEFPIQKNNDSDSAFTNSTPLIQYYSQLKEIAHQNLQLEKNKALPGFSIGYLNQATADTPTALRIRAGINFPLWFWQYSASIKAAKTYRSVTFQNLLAQQQSVDIQIQQSRNEISKFQESLDYYENSELKLSEDLIESAKRLFEAGETDYMNYLRTLSDALNIKINYLEAMKNYNQSIIYFNFLTGQK